jgi:hypothetical protein
MAEWTDDELEASVVAYRDMERLEADGKRYSKAAYYADLSSRFGRNAKAFERRLQNISAVLDQRGEPWLKGLAPAAHIGSKVAGRIEGFLSKHPVRTVPRTPSYKLKLPAMRQWLIRVARTGQPVTYGQVMAAFGLDRFSLRYALGNLGREAREREEPVITALVVGKATGHCGPGFNLEFGIEDDAAERKRLYRYWRKHEPEVAPPASTPEGRLAKFVSVEARPDQAAFRRRVFEAYGGCCVISGCDLSVTLDAAHKTGRSWRHQNAVTDGYLMRKDLHALYDDGLLTINDEGIVKLAQSVMAQYGQFAGMKIRAAV